MKRRALLPVLLAFALACGSCGGQKYTGSPNDPNEQQGNPNAHPAQSDTNKSNKQPSDNQAGRNAHTGKANADNNQ